MSRLILRRRDFIAGLGSVAAIWPLAARAQQPTPTIGLLSSVDLAAWAITAFRTGLGEAGFADGRNVAIISRSAENHFDRLPALAADLVTRKVAVIFATGSPVPVRVAKAATSKIPIVFAYGGDPVADGLVASFNRPEANVTGATFNGSELAAKRMELLHEIAPHASEVALLVNPNGTLAAAQIKDATAAAQTLGQHLHVVKASTDSEIDEAFAEMDRLRVGGLAISTDPVFGFLHTNQLVALAARYRIPTVYVERRTIEAGGLASYGASLPDTWRQAGIYVGRILSGETPSELPIVQPTQFELAINLKTATALGLEIPPTLLGRADAVVE